MCLLVDDDLDDHDIFSLALQEAESTVEVVRAYDGEEALERLEAADEILPDVIFMDLNMPGMDGKECLAEIRRREHLNDIPVVIYSTSVLIQDMIDVQNLGASAFIVKSAELSELTSSLKHFFRSNH